MCTRAQLCLSIVALTTVSGTLGSGHCVEVYRKQNTCCKVDKLWDQDNLVAVSQFPCSNGCCGEPDNQYCCTVSSGGINKEALPYVIGFSIFGVLVLIGLTILLVWVFRKVCSAVKDRSNSRQAMTGLKEQLEVALLQNGDRPMLFKDLFSKTPAPPPTTPGAIVHELTKADTISTLSPHSGFGLRANLPSQRPDLHYSGRGDQSTRHPYGSDTVGPSAPFMRNYAYDHNEFLDIDRRDGRPFYATDQGEIMLGMNRHADSQLEYGSNYPPSYESQSQFGATYVPPPSYHETVYSESKVAVP